MSRFRELSSFSQPLSSGYRLLPFRFAALDGARYVATNVVGEHIVCTREAIETLARHQLPHSNPLYDLFKSRHFLIDDDSDVAEDLIALKMRTKLRHLENFTSLHMFVVTLRCEHSCQYCQVSRQTDDRIAFDMTEATAEQALAHVFRSPSPSIKIEFQGGEPLLNFDLVKFIVQRSEVLNESHKKHLQYVIATNLAMVTEDILNFCKEHEILISTSLDGPEELHNRNRPRPGRNSYRKTIEGIERARATLGFDRVSALMTTTLSSLPRVTEIIDEYVERGFDSIFLRPLSPYGFAVRTKGYDAYSRDAWLAFYKEGLEHIIAINKRGVPFGEQYASIMLNKILSPWNPGYVDLMSPSGAGIAAIVYNYDGYIYAADEARMLAEMGDTKFQLGRVTDSYEEVFLSPVLLEALDQSFSGSAPMCAECAFEPYCGSDPIYHYATQKDFVGKKPLSSFCHRHMEMCRYLIATMNDDVETRELFYRWAFR